MLTCTLLSNAAVRIPALCPSIVPLKSASHGLRIAGLAIAFTLSIVAGQAVTAGSKLSLRDAACLLNRLVG